MNLTIDTDQVKRFFNALWPSQDEGFLVISSKGSVGGFSSKFFSHPLQLDLVCSATERLAGRDVWFTIGLNEKRPEKGRGTAEVVIGIPGLVGDIDCSGGVHNQKDLPTKEQALKLISEFPFLPSILVWSGGGYQVYHLFDEPWIFEGPEDKEKAKDLSSSWQKFIMARGKEKGWKLDNVGSIEHLFRVPGTYNHKGEPVPVEIVEVNNERF